MNNFQTQRLDLQKEEIRLIQESIDNSKNRLKAQDGFAAANSMLEKYGHRMSETLFAYWFDIANKWAMEMSSFNNPTDYSGASAPSAPSGTSVQSGPSGQSGPSRQSGSSTKSASSVHHDYDTPIISSDRNNTNTEDNTTMSRLYESSASETSQSNKRVRDYSSLSNSHQSGRPSLPSTILIPSDIIESVITRRSQEHELLNGEIIELPISAEATLEFILGKDGEPTVEYQTSIPLFQPATVPSYHKEAIPKEAVSTTDNDETVPPTSTATLEAVPSTSNQTSVSTHPFTKDPLKHTGLLRSAPSFLLKQKQQKEDRLRSQYNPHGMSFEPLKTTVKGTSSSSSSSSSSSKSSNSKSSSSKTVRESDATEGKRTKKKRTIESV